jgi:hypothetical protein
VCLQIHGGLSTLDNHKDDKIKNLDEKKDGTQINPLMTAYLIKNIVKLYKTHRSAADFDCGFVAGIVNTMKGLRAVPSNGNVLLLIFD